MTGFDGPRSTIEMKDFIVRWASTTFAVLIATGVVPGITFENLGALLWAGLLLGILNAVVRPVLLVFSLPLIVLSLGLFIPIINALLLHFVGGGWIEGFHVDGFWSAFFGALVISAVSSVISHLFKEDRGVEVRVRNFSREEPPLPPGEMKRVEGRVIEHDDEREKK